MTRRLSFQYPSTYIEAVALTSWLPGVDPWVDRGHVQLLFEVEGTHCVLSPYFFRG